MDLPQDFIHSGEQGRARGAYHHATSVFGENRLVSVTLTFISFLQVLLGLASAAPAADFDQHTGHHNHFNALPDLPILSDGPQSGNFQFLESDNYLDQTAFKYDPLPVADSYGAPAADPLSYSALAESDSYGAPVAPVVGYDSYGAPAAPPIASDGCRDPKNPPPGYECKKSVKQVEFQKCKQIPRTVESQVCEETQNDTLCHTEYETVYEQQCETGYETVYEYEAVPLAPLPHGNTYQAANPFYARYQNSLNPDQPSFGPGWGDNPFGSPLETARAGGQRPGFAIPPSAQYLTHPQPPRRQLRPRIDNKPKGILEEMNSTLQKLGRQAHSWNVSMLNKISNLFL